jgi:hypothetical protein
MEGRVVLVYWSMCAPAMPRALAVHSNSKTKLSLTLWRRNFLLNFSTLCISNMNNTDNKHGSIMK